MIGWFGWLDNPTATLVWIPWTAALAFLVFVALAWVRRRHAVVLLALLAGVVVVPVVVNATPYNADGAFWQGSYTLPLAVGVPILAAFTLAATERGRDLVNSRFVLVVGLVVGFGQLLAFAQDLSPVCERPHLAEDAVADDAAHLWEEAGLNSIQATRDELRGLLRARERARENERVWCDAFGERPGHRATVRRQRALLIPAVGPLRVAADFEDRHATRLGCGPKEARP